MTENQTPAPRTFEEAVDLVLAQMRHTMIERQRKYGPENIFKQGLEGVLGRTESDKLARLHHYYDREFLRQKNLAQGVPQEVIDQYLPAHGGDFPDDSIEDAHIDAANYVGPISLMLKRGWWGLPLAEEGERSSGHQDGETIVLAGWIELNVSAAVTVRVLGTWDDPEGYEVETGDPNDVICLSVDQAQVLYATLPHILARATTLAKRRGVSSLLPTADEARKDG